MKRLLTILLVSLLMLGGKTVMSDPKVKIEITMNKAVLGDIVIELNEKKAPNSTANFLSYVKSGFYNGTIFHRVIPNFMIQGAGMTPDMREKGNKVAIKNEANNGLKNDRGTLAMARTNAPHSATSQFFINTKDNAFLNFRSEDAQGWGYAVFGKVVQGMEIVDKIEKVRTGSRGHHGDVPVETISISSTSIISK